MFFYTVTCGDILFCVQRLLLLPRKVIDGRLTLSKLTSFVKHRALFILVVVCTYLLLPTITSVYCRYFSCMQPPLLAYQATFLLTPRVRVIFSLGYSFHFVTFSFVKLGAL